LDTFQISAYDITPSNDTCENAIELAVGSNFEEEVITATLEGATDDLGGSTPDIWFSVVVPESGNITIETDYATDSPMHDTFLFLFSGECGTSQTGFDDNSGNGDFAKLELSGYTPGDVLRVKVDKDADSGDPVGAFLISAYDLIPPPSNDECVDAINLDVQYNTADYTSTTPYAGTIEAATDSGIPASSCDGWTGTANDDVWFTFTPNIDNLYITLEDEFDGVLELFSGTCDDLTLINCADNGAIPEIDATDLTIGEQYFFRVFNFGITTTSLPNFNISVWTENHGVGLAEEVIDGFAMHPNPVEDVLTVNADNTITTISVYNLIGQEVLTALPNTTETQVDMSNLPAGTYIVKVQAGSQLGSYNLIKE
jgi:hypothetical protein